LGIARKKEKEKMKDGFLGQIPLWPADVTASKVSAGGALIDTKITD
jgi:hypothetical protein